MRHLLWLLILTAGTTPLGAQEQTVRFATFNVSLHFSRPGELAEKLAGGHYEPAKKLAAIIQKTRPDVLLLNEFDRDDDDRGVGIFVRQYLAVSQFQQAPVNYPYHFAGPVNTGVLAPVDLNGDGKITSPQDTYGFGLYPGQYAMVVLSRLPLEHSEVRTFRKFLWRDMPDAWWPLDPQTGQQFYSEEARAVLRLSSKSHWDIPIISHNGRTVHFLVSHPTPPVFDGPEDRNGHRNYDEIRFWRDYIDKAPYLYDDNGNKGGLEDPLFVIAGDLNADPNDGASARQAVRQLTEHPRINHHRVPASEGALEQSGVQAGVNLNQRGNPAEDTADFDDRGAGNLHIDHVLPSQQLEITASGVFWPPSSAAESKWLDASDHRLVWVDVRL